MNQNKITLKLQFYSNQFHFPTQCHLVMPWNITNTFTKYLAQSQFNFSFGHFSKHLMGSNQQTTTTIANSVIRPGFDLHFAPTCPLHQPRSMPCPLCPCFDLAKHGINHAEPLMSPHDELATPLHPSIDHLV